MFWFVFPSLVDVETIIRSYLRFKPVPDTQRARSPIFTDDQAFKGKDFDIPVARGHAGRNVATL